MKVLVPFPQDSKNLEEFLKWCTNNLGKMGRDWDVMPADQYNMKVIIRKDDLDLSVQLKLIWG